MSDSPPRPENASPRVSPDVGEDRDADSGASPPSAALAAASAAPLGPTTPAGRRSAGQLPLRSRHTFSPQLSERESIFATHYLTGENSSTPRQGSPAPQSADKGKGRESRYDAAPAVGSPSTHAALPLLRPRPAGQERPATITQSPATPGSIAPFSLDTKKRTLSQGNGERAPVSASHHGQGVTATMIPFPPDGEITRQRRQSQAAPRQTLRKSSTWDPSDSGQLVSAASGMEGQVRARDFGIRDDGAAERLAGNEAEQQIEATIAEPLANTRSRKASHYLGLFKENTGQQDGKKARAKSKEVKKALTSDDAVIAEKPAEEEKASDVSISGPTSPKDIFKDQKQKTLGVHPVTAELDAHADAPSTSEKCVVRASSTKSRSKEVSKGQESIEWRAGESARGTVHLRLLEEIRRHSFPTPSPEDEGDEEVSSESPKSDEGAKAIRHGRELNESSQQDFGLVPASGNDEDDEDFESDKERISAATYFPHHTPDPSVGGQDTASIAHEELIERRKTLKTVDEDAEDEQEGPIAYPTLEGGTKEVSRPQLSSDQDEGPRSTWTPAETSSDTDYESWDDTAKSELGYDSGVTDKGDATPTATPSAHKYLHLHSRHAPLGAVELKPYKHQVGGHTKVFSFSKQAICKQLNNRENVFYEVIERRHPELLKFLPKYVCPAGATCKAAQAKTFQSLSPETTALDRRIMYANPLVSVCR